MTVDEKLLELGEIGLRQVYKSQTVLELLSSTSKLFSQLSTGGARTPFGVLAGAPAPAFSKDSRGRAYNAPSLHFLFHSPARMNDRGPMPSLAFFERFVPPKAVAFRSPQSERHRSFNCSWVWGPFARV